MRVDGSSGPGGISLISGYLSTPSLHAPVGAVVGASAVWLVIRRINRRQVARPRHTTIDAWDKFWIDIAGIVAVIGFTAILAAVVYASYYIHKMLR